MTPTPFFSVIMPVFNGADFLQRSIGSLLLQTDSDWELLAVDDGSGDGSVAILEQFARSDPRIHLDHSSGSDGPARPRNVGLECARGEVICFLDQDDEWLPHKLARQREKLASGSFGLVYSDAFVDFHGERQLWSDRWGPLVEGQVAGALIDRNFVPALTAAFPSDVARSVGKIDEHLSGADDYDYWLRIAFDGREIGLIDEPLAVWWYRDHNLSNSQIWHAQRLIRCLHKHLKRQRRYAPALRRRIRVTRARLLLAALNELRHGRDPAATRAAAMVALSSVRSATDARHLLAAIRARGRARKPQAPAAGGKNMKILLLSQEHGAVIGTGGVGAYVMDIAPALAARGHEVHVLSCRDGVPPSDVIDNGVVMHVRPLLRCRGLTRVVRGQQLRTRLVLGMSNFVHARRLAQRFDVVEAPEWQAEGWVFAALNRSRLVVHLHSPTRLLREYGVDPSVPLSGDDRAADWIERVTTNRASLVTSPSALLVDDLRARRWLRSASTRIIRLPIDLRPWRAVPSARGTDRVVLAVGRVERLKSPELLVDAIAILRQRGIAATATFAGRSSGERDGVPYRQWLLDYAKRVNVPIEIVEESPRHQLVEIYSRCRAVCIASAYESFSIAAMEGMAAGRATVVHPRVGAAEIYTGAARSQVCERSPQGIADALAPLLEDEDLAVRLGAADRESVSAVCDAEVVAQAREAALAEVLIRRNRRRRRRRGRNR